MTKYIAAIILLLTACGPLDSWNAPKVGYIDRNTDCPRYAHTVRGPDAYDIAHNRPYHCEVPAPDLDNIDIDQVDQ